MHRINVPKIQIALSLLILILVVLRAMELSITHDEAGTYLFYHDKNLLQYLNDKSIWDSANNHLLNTYLYQKSISIFGFTDFTLRLPNVLAYCLYAFSMLKIISIEFREQKLLSILLFSLCLVNPYLIDFFSLARGYGLSLGFIALSILLILKYYRTQKAIFYALHLISLILASFSILSNLILIPCSVFAVLSISRLSKGKNFVKLLLISITTLLLSVALFYVPVSALIGIDEFRYGVPYLYDSYRFYVEDYLYDYSYLGDFTRAFFLICFFALIAFSVYQLIRSLVKHKDNFSFWILSFFLLINVGLVVSHYILGTNFPSNRKFLFMVPIFAIVLCLGMKTISLNQNIMIFLIGLMLFNLLHFLVIKKDVTKEWRYDSETRDIISDLANDYCFDTNCTLATNWKFHPTSNYYIQKNSFNWLTLGNYEKAINQMHTFDYYLCFDSDYDLLKEKYKILKKYKSNIYLLKLKNQ